MKLLNISEKTIKIIWYASLNRTCLAQLPNGTCQLIINSISVQLCKLLLKDEDNKYTVVKLDVSSFLPVSSL